MSRDYTHFVDLAREVEPPEDGILTRTLFNHDDLKVVIFSVPRKSTQGYTNLPWQLDGAVSGLFVPDVLNTGTDES